MREPTNEQRAAAREWIDIWVLPIAGELIPGTEDALLALLAEREERARLPVEAWKDLRAISDRVRADTLAEVKRVVEQVRDTYRGRWPCDEILRRLKG